MVPQVGQGALAVECRRDDRYGGDGWPPIEYAVDRLAVDLERAFLAELGGGCDLPVGAHAPLDTDGSVVLWSFLAGDAGTRASARSRRRSRLGARPSPGRRAASLPRGAERMDADQPTDETVELLQS